MHVYNFELFLLIFAPLIGHKYVLSGLLEHVGGEKMSEGKFLTYVRNDERFVFYNLFNLFYARRV